MLNQVSNALWSIRNLWLWSEGKLKASKNIFPLKCCLKKKEAVLWVKVVQVEGF